MASAPESTVSNVEGPVTPEVSAIVSATAEMQGEAAHTLNDFQNPPAVNSWVLLYGNLIIEEPERNAEGDSSGNEVNGSVASTLVLQQRIEVTLCLFSVKPDPEQNGSQLFASFKAVYKQSADRDLGDKFFSFSDQLS
ncbi:hypothetical protein NDU88_004314 [Pleurodeles waltl]|uniref:Uncharacterized protein n=1 Tax=Pleurodeles waltl TaxID=8319 RepID=A0AAV7W9E0_PLEWA|nr:hypothetical protein NDU88_004314 [Pleurodeles waltl]